MKILDKKLLSVISKVSLYSLNLKLKYSVLLLFNINDKSFDLIWYFELSCTDNLYLSIFVWSSDFLIALLLWMLSFLFYDAQSGLGKEGGGG